MPKSEENWEGFTEEEERLWRETVKTGPDMRRMFNMRDERRQREQEEELKEQWPLTEAARLFAQLGESGWHTGTKSGHKAGLRPTGGDEQRGQREF